MLSSLHYTTTHFSLDIHIMALSCYFFGAWSGMITVLCTFWRWQFRAFNDNRAATSLWGLCQTFAKAGAYPKSKHVSDVLSKTQKNNLSWLMNASVKQWHRNKRCSGAKWAMNPAIVPKRSKNCICVCKRKHSCSLRALPATVLAFWATAWAINIQKTEQRTDVELGTYDEIERTMGRTAVYSSSCL